MNKKTKLLVAVVLSGLGIYFSFKGESFDELLFHLKTVNLIKITFAVLLLILSCIPRALRWKLLLEPFDQFSFHRVFGATMIGYFGNGVLVFRLGEFLKAFAVSKGYEVTVAQAFGTVIIERILDLVMVVILLFFLIPWFPFHDGNIQLAIILSALFLVIILAFIFTIIKLNLKNKLDKLIFLDSIYIRTIFDWINKLFDGITSIARNQNFLIIVFLSILIWVIYYFITLLVLSGCGIQLSFVEAGILFTLSSLLLGIPALPGSLGTLDVGVKYVLMYIFSISSAQALNYSIISHAIAYFPCLLIGLVYFFTSNISIKDMNKDSTLNEKI